MARRKKLKVPGPVKMQVRLPGSVHSLLKEAKELEHTSMNALIVRFIGESARKAIQRHRQLAMFETETTPFAGARNPTPKTQKGSK